MPLIVLAGNSLITRAGVELNFEGTPTSYPGTITVFDTAGNSRLASFTITITNVNEAPTDITLSASTVSENSAPGTVIGTFTGVDPDAGPTFTYALTNDGGGRFKLVGAVLQVNANIDFETTPTIQVTVMVTDQGALSFTKSFTITIVRTEVVFVCGLCMCGDIHR